MTDTRFSQTPFYSSLIKTVGIVTSVIVSIQIVFFLLMPPIPFIASVGLLAEIFVYVVVFSILLKRTSIGLLKPIPHFLKKVIFATNSISLLAVLLFIVLDRSAFFSSGSTSVEQGERSFLFFSWLLLTQVLHFVVFGSRSALVISGMFSMGVFLIGGFGALISTEKTAELFAVSVCGLTSGIMGMLFGFYDHYRQQLFEQSKRALYIGDAALLDALTKLPNHLFLVKNLEATLHRFTRHGEQFGAILLEIDEFESLQARFGESKTSEALQVVAQVVQKHTRNSDYCGRWGACQFLLIVGLNSKEGIAKFGERLRFLIERSRSSGLPTFTASLGAGVVKKGDDIDSFLKRINEALKKAQKQGGNCYIMK